MKIESGAIETTAQYHLKIVYELIREGIPVLVANPQQTKNTQGKKTDKLDARRIAIAHRDGRLKPSVIPPEELFNLRKATKHKLKLIGEMTKIKQRLDQVFHNKDFYYKNLLKSKRGLEILKLVVSNRMIDEEIV
ncbi:MAG: IS110 family transposase, partial [Candidatus Helarchaeota archaeon]